MMVDENDSDTIEMVIDEPSDIAETPKETAVKALRNPVNGQFVKGGPPGPGRPKGSRDRFSKQVIDSLQACWEANAEQMLAELVASKPEVVMGMVSRLLPQAVITEDLTGEKEKGEGNQQDITIRLVQQVADDALPPREVEGELLPLEETKH